MKVKSFLNVHNKFEAVLVDTRTGKIKQKATAYNVVTDQYYSWVRSGGGSDVTYIAVGTGTGVPSAADTSMFQYLTKANGDFSAYHKESTNMYSRQLVVTFNENEANGNLTEVGLVTYQSVTCTHAMFTDAESNPITITKTNTDRLTITATVYMTITNPNNLIPALYSPYLPLTTNPAANLESEPDIPVSFDQESGIPAPWLLRHLQLTVNNSTDSGSGSEFLLGLCLAKDTQALSFGWGESVSMRSITAQGQPAGRRCTGSLIQSSSWNTTTGLTYQIYGVMTALGLFQFPDPTLFTPYELTIERTADGSTTEFNFGVPELSSSVSVYIDGVLQNSGYTWNRKDFNLRQAWASQHGTYMIDCVKAIRQRSSTYTSPFYSPIVAQNQFKGTGSSAWFDTRPKERNGAVTADFPDGSYDFVYDFTTAKAVNTLKSYRNSDIMCILYYSNDKTTWTEAARIPKGSSETVTVTFNTISARYWKTCFSYLGGVVYMANDGLARFFGAFDEVKPQLKFTNPPANGSVVKIVANTEYPIKNLNWLIDQTIVDFDITKAGS